MAITKVSRGLLSTGISDSSDATAVTITSDEKVGLGVTTPANYLFSNPLAISAPSGANSGLTIVSATNSNGTIAMADGTSGNEAYKGYLQYSHASDAMFIGAGGSAIARFDSHGIKFGSDSAEANALDDYEEGTWTPVHGGNNMTGTATYTKVGRYVYIAGDVTSASGSSTSSTISGLPFTVLTSHHHGSFVVGWTNTGVQGGYVANASTFIEAVNAGTNTADTISAGGRIIFAASFITA